jgi:hypothetical protein
MRYGCNEHEGMWFLLPSVMFCDYLEACEPGYRNDTSSPCRPCTLEELTKQAPLLSARNPGAPVADADGTCSFFRGPTVRRAHDPNAKYGAAGDAVPSQLLQYTVTYENEGEGRAYGVYVTDELSPHLDETTLELNGQGTFYPATRTIIWNVGELASKGEDGSKGEVSFSVRARSGLPSGTVITNQARVFFPSVPEETPTNSVVNVVQPLAAIPQSVETAYGQSIAVTLSGADVSGSPLTYQVKASALNGDLSGVPPLLTYTPATNFTGLDRFSFTVSNGVSQSRPADIAVLVQPSPADTIPPEVVWTYPEDGATVENVSPEPITTDAIGAAWAPSLHAVFSEAMDPASITKESFELSTGGGVIRNFSVTWDGTVNQALIVPREPWQEGDYTVTVTTDVRDASGNPLAAEYEWSFRIGAAVPHCTGDCNEDGNVTVDELIKGVNIALGSATIENCPVFDKNDDGTVTVDELVTGVNNALSGCAEPTPLF